MEVSYYPGCSLEGTAKEYSESLEGVAHLMDINLRELKDWNCCGASSAHALNHRLALSLAARNLAVADKSGLDLVVPCAACFQRLKVAEKKLVAGEKIDGVNGYGGKFKVKHVANFFWEDLGEDRLSAKVKVPLENLQAVCYYGCLTTRPPKVTDAASAENPMSMDSLLTCLGVDVRPWSYKADCCGGSLILTRPDIARDLMVKLLDAAVEAGAECIVAGCPMCLSNLDGRQGEISKATGKEYRIPIFYFTELMGIAYKHPSAKKWLRRHIVDPRPLLSQKGLI